jgi:mono/diheme cytochrome c family protein
MRLTIAAAIILGSAVASRHAQAQAAGDPQAGLALAREVCASCHAVLAGETQSPNARAPSFEAIAHTPGMTSTALTVALRTSHQTMPNLMFEADELQNLIAYVLSLNRSR